LPQYKYLPIKETVEEQYIHHTGSSVYEMLGQDVDFDKILLIVEADDEDQANRIRMGVTDYRMWKLITD